MMNMTYCMAIVRHIHVRTCNRASSDWSYLLFYLKLMILVSLSVIFSYRLFITQSKILRAKQSNWLFCVTIRLTSFLQAIPLIVSYICPITLLVHTDDKQPQTRNATTTIKYFYFVRIYRASIILRQHDMIYLALTIYLTLIFKYTLMSKLRE